MQAKKAEAPKTGTALVPKPNRHRASATPKALQKLCDKLGVPAVAARIGYSESSIYTMLGNNSCVKVVEIAAEFMLNDMEGSKRTHLYVVKVPADYTEAVEKTLKAFDCQFRHYVD